MRLVPWLLLGVVWVSIATLGQTAAIRYQPLLDNPWVNLSGLDLPPRRQAVLYQNTHEVFWIALNSGSAILVDSDGIRTKLELAPGDTRFFRRYQVKSVWNEGADSLRAVVVEIKRRGLLADACYCTDKIESAICGCGASAHLPEMWASGVGQIMAGGTTLAAGQSYERAVQRGPTLLVALTRVQLLDQAAETEAAGIDLSPGQAAWLQAGWHKFKNTGRESARFVSFEF